MGILFRSGIASSKSSISNITIVKKVVGVRLSLTRTDNCNFQRWTYCFAEMGKTARGYYAVARGRAVGIYHTWDECKAQVDSFPNARYKKFPTNEEAESFVAANRKTSVTSKPVNSFNPPKTTLPTSNGTRFNTSNSKNTRTTMFIDALPVPGPAALYAGQSVALASASSRHFTTSAGLNKRALRVTEDIVTGRKRSKLEREGANSNLDHSKFTFDDEGYVVVYTDGACKANGKGKKARAGVGVWFEDNHSLNISERVKGRQTNNTAEIQAAEFAILQAKSAGIGKLTLKTDSQFTINCVTKWLKNWKRNGWKLANGQDVKNREDLIKLDKAIDGIEIKWSYVKAHCGLRGNEAADRLAVQGSGKN